MENMRIENTEQPFLVNGYDSSDSNQSPPLRRSSSRANKRHFTFTTSPANNINCDFHNNKSKKNRRQSIKHTRRYGKYDHVSSKVKEYRIAIQNLTTNQNQEISPYEDTFDITSSENLLQIIENLKQDIKMRDAIIDKRDDEIAELMGKHVEEVALLKMSLDSFRYEIMRLKGTIDISRPYSKQNNEITPLKTIGNMLKTPIRSISKVLLRTPLRTLSSSTSATVMNDVQNKSITSDDVEIEDQNSCEETPNQKPFLQSSLKNKKSPEWIKFSDSNTASSVSKTSDPTLLKKTKDPKRKNILEHSVSSVFSKVVYYSQKVFSKNKYSLNEKAEENRNASPQIVKASSNRKIRKIRRSVSFSKTCTKESPLPKIIVDDTDSPKHCFQPPKKMKKLKIHEYISAKRTKENNLKSRANKNNEDFPNYKDHETLITAHIDEIIARSKEIKKIIDNKF